MKRTLVSTSNIDEIHGDSKKSDWDEASIFSKYTFSVANKFLKLGISKTIQEDDLMIIPEHDYVIRLLPMLQKQYKQSKKFLFIPRLLVSLIKYDLTSFILIAVYTLIEGATRVLLPLILLYLLQTLHDVNSSDAVNYKWAGIFSAIAIIQTISHHILFYYSMRSGWNWKASATALIYDRLFLLNGNMKNFYTTGKLVNLISNDVARFEDFAIFACFSWESILELAAILIVLIYILNYSSAIAGVGTTVLFIPIQIKLAKEFAQIRGLTAQATDQRVRYISEVIDGISSVKSFGWEKPFYKLIQSYRNQEIKHVDYSQMLRAINLGLFYSAHIFAAFVTFLVFWLTGNTLTLPIVFSALALLQTLRVTIGRFWTRSIETGSEAIASCYRIEAFLNLVDNELLNDYRNKPGNIDETMDTSDVSPDTQISPANLNINQSTHEPSSFPSTISADTSIQASNMLLFSINNSSFYYGDEDTKPTISNISFTVQRGELVIICGSVGSGKSSLLAAILDEIKEVLPKHSTLKSSQRYLKPSTRIAYCAQRTLQCRYL